MRKILFVSLCAAGVGATAYGCGSAPSDCTALDTCGGSDGGGMEGGGEAGDSRVPPDARHDAAKEAGIDGETGVKDVTSDDAPTCDLMQAPSNNNCVLQDGNGLFVAPAPYGNNSSGTGTIEAPFATLQGRCRNSRCRRRSASTCATGPTATSSP
jgi:hypothetical protein